MLSERSAAGETTAVTLALLLIGNGSAVVDETTAVSVIDPTTDGKTAMETVALAPLARLPKLVTMVLPLLTDEPCELEAARIPTLAGSVLLSITLAAVAGPLFVTEAV